VSRQEKVAEAIKRIISNFIVQDRLKDPRIGFITITKVELSHDLRNANVFFSVLGKDADYKDTKEALDDALGFIRTLVARNIRLRFAPELTFKEDRSSEYSVKIEEILNEIKEKDEHKKSRRLLKKK